MNKKCDTTLFGFGEDSSAWICVHVSLGLLAMDGATKSMRQTSSVSVV